MTEIKRYKGTVKWFSGQKGFGFIAPADGSGDLFVHQTEIKAEGFRFLKDGQRVEFSVDSGGDGQKKAVDVVGLGGTYHPGPRRGVHGRRGGYGGYRGGFSGGADSMRGGRFGRSYGGGGGGRIRGPECYNCGRVGHFARDCYRVRSDRAGGGQGYHHDHGIGGGGGRNRACYHCGEEGHFARDCPNQD